MNDPFHFRTERLLIDVVTLDDLEAFHAMRNHPKSLERYAEKREPETLEFTRGLIEGMIEHNATDRGYNFAIKRREDGKTIGSVGLWKLDVEARVSEIGYMLAVETWGQGYMTEALEAFFEAARARYAPMKVEAFVRPDNLASVRLLERRGFVFIDEEVPRDPGYRYSELML